MTGRHGHVGTGQLPVAGAANDAVVAGIRPPGHAQRILVVEDSATQAAALAGLLEEHGFEVTVARDGTAALAAVRAEHFDLVLSDIVMPGMTGYEVCRRVKTELGHPELPVVLLTGLSDPMDIVRGLECGADNYITKPYDRDHLLDRVRLVLDNRRLRHGAKQGGSVDITFLGKRFTITAEKEQILDLLVSSYEELVRTNQAVRHAERRARFLAEASGVLATSLEVDTILQNLVRFIVPAIADICVADIVEDSGKVRRVDVAHATPALSDVADALRRRTLSMEETSQATNLLQRNTPVLIGDLQSADLRDATPGEVTLHEAKAMGMRSLIAVPLIARGHAVGALLFMAGDTRHHYTAEDLALTVELARQAALAVDNARLYRAARMATRARDDLLAIVSHDLRNPIHAIYMAATFLLDVLPERSDVPDIALSRRQAEVIRRSARRGNTLIGDLLDVTRIEDGRLTVKTQPVESAELLSEAIHDATPLAQQKELSLESFRDGPLPVVNADRSRIAQVFSNLLGNAIKFTPPGGEIRVDARVSGDSLHFSVSDSGPGITAEHLPHLFDRYWQARETQQLGTGLGLFIARGITEAHGGQLWAESEPGAGATFHFTLPLGRSQGTGEG
ncbi:MAG: hybrid sensor histidine kinase/response regulator [Gemmatimonadaceae bacterium]